jgi:PAS domain S-box-containing protein
VYGELLQVLGDSLLREHYRMRQYEQAAAIINYSGDAIISEDLDGVTTSWNTGAERLFGFTEREAIGKPVTLLVHPDVLDDERGIVEHILRGVTLDHYETIYQHKDRSLIEISLTASPIRDANGRIIGVSKIARDITERKRHENHREFLINELNHRVKNTLATVQSFAMQTLRNATTLAEGRNSLEERLVALARAHDGLTREHWRGADLNGVVADSVTAYAGDPGESRFRVAGPIVRLQPKSALALSMALHELATNAVKYGALSNGTGSVEIHWRITQDDPQQFRLRWVESGGPPVETPRRRGFGSRLVEQGLAQDLAGKVRLDFQRSGLICTIDAPLEEVVGSVKNYLGV